MNKFIAIDLFSGCGGMTEGMKRAGFDVVLAIEKDDDAAICFIENHPKTNLIKKDVKEIKGDDIKKLLNNEQLHLLAGCPPCQGFSSIRRLNRKHSVRDKRNSLILEYLRFVKALKPFTIMFENVPGIVNYYLFNNFISKLRKMNYYLDYKIVNMKNYGIPQRRKRIVLVGSLLGEINIAETTNEKVSVKDTIGNLDTISKTNDPIHRVVARHKKRTQEIISLIPKNGGSRKDLPEEYILECHKKKNVGFNNIYGRLKWDDYSSTISGGCLNPSKGRFLHPEENRCITAREAALLQTFPPEYKFPEKISKTSLAALIGNALPPKFSCIQSKNIISHLKLYYD